MTNGVTRAVRTPASTPAAPTRSIAPGERWRGSVEMSTAEMANVPALARNAIGADDTASSTAPSAGPTTTPRSWTVWSSALAGPSRRSPTRRGRSASAACCSALPAADDMAARAITSATGPSPATTAASTSMRTRRSRSPISRTVRRG